jgi:hypothetical protein
MDGKKRACNGAIGCSRHAISRMSQMLKWIKRRSLSVIMDNYSPQIARKWDSSCGIMAQTVEAPSPSNP